MTGIVEALLPFKSDWFTKVFGISSRVILHMLLFYILELGYNLIT